MAQADGETDKAIVDSPEASLTRVRKPKDAPKRETAWNALTRAATAIIEDQDIEAAREAIRRALNAKKWVRTGKDQWEEVDDGQVQGAIGVKVLEWAIGKPRETVEVQHTAIESGDPVIRPGDLRRLTQARPDLARSIIDELIAEAKPVELVEIAPVTPESEAKQLIGNQKVSPEKG